MRFTVPPSALAAAARIVSRAVSRTSVLPVLHNVCLEVTSDLLTLSATDLELAIQMTIPATETEGGAITVPAREFLDLAGSATGGELRAESAEQTSLAIVSGRAKYRLMGVSSEEFPPLPEVKPENTVVLPVDTFAAALKRILPAVGEDITRPVLTAVSWGIGGGKLTLAATDTHRLAVETLTPTNVTGERCTLIPGSALEHLLRILDAKSEEPVSVTWDENQISFRAGPMLLISRLIKGTFPKYERVIPKDHTTRALVDVADWAAAVSRLRPFTDKERVELHFTEDTLFLHAQNGELGEANEEAAAEIEGPELTLVLNARYLLDLLAVAPGERIAAEMTQPLHPVLFRPEEAGVEYRHVIMTMQPQ